MKKILVIEDNLDVRENIAEILELSDYKVLQAADGKAGDHNSFKQRMRILFKNVFVFKCAWFAFVPVDNQVLWFRISSGNKAPLHPCWEPCAT